MKNNLEFQFWESYSLATKIHTQNNCRCAVDFNVDLLSAVLQLINSILINLIILVVTYLDPRSSLITSYFATKNEKYRKSIYSFHLMKTKMLLQVVLFQIRRNHNNNNNTNHLMEVKFAVSYLMYDLKSYDNMCACFYNVAVPNVKSCL